MKYAHRSGSTKIDFEGLRTWWPAPSAKPKVDSHRGAMEIKVEFQKMLKPTTFGGEYLTYVLQAISPEGRAVNLGEVLIGGNDRSKLDVTTDLQTFALIVTAEPYYAVRRPSNVVVMENVIRLEHRRHHRSGGCKIRIDRPRRLHSLRLTEFDPVVLNSKLPLEFFEARNALRIAESAGAANYATESYNKRRRTDEAGR